MLVNARNNEIKAKSKLAVLEQQNQQLKKRNIWIIRGAIIMSKGLNVIEYDNVGLLQKEPFFRKVS